MAPEDIVTKHEKKEKEQDDQDETNEDFKESLKGKEDEEQDFPGMDEEEEDDDDVEEEISSGADPELEENVLQSTGAMLTKFEVFVSFLQVYGIIFNFDLQIKWPLNFAWFNNLFMWLPIFFLMDLTYLIDAFGFSIPSGYFVYLKFLGTLLSFFLIALTYVIFKGWSRRKFLGYGVRHWD